MNQPPLNPDALGRMFAAAMMEVLDAEKLQPGDRLVHVNDVQEVLNRLEKNILAAALPEVTSVEELDQLPMHTYVQGDDGFKHAKDWNGGWHLIVNRPSSAPHLSGSIALPARVLYRPEVKP